MAFREALAAAASALYRAPIEAFRIAVTPGCNQAFATAMMAIAASGDNVILPTPYYFNHAQTLALLGVEARLMPCDPALGFVPEPEDAAALMDGRTRAVVLVTPNNPTGAIYPPETIAAFATMLRRSGRWLVLDETYRDFLPDTQAAPHGLFADPAWPRNVVSLFSLSKSCAIPGQRIGGLIAGGEAMAEIGKVLDNLQICPPRAPQIALAEELADLAPWIAANRAEINRRARGLRGAFAALDTLRIERIGAYFAYVRAAGAEDTHDLCRRIAARTGVLMLPGRSFGPGQERHLRLAFANAPLPTLLEAVARLKRFESSPAP
jgi:aspartate/methionine/tyrosine aminotransferase